MCQGESSESATAPFLATISAKPCGGFFFIPPDSVCRDICFRFGAPSAFLRGIYLFVAIFTQI
jgi:hypothetical protein